MELPSLWVLHRDVARDNAGTTGILCHPILVSAVWVVAKGEDKCYNTQQWSHEIRPGRISRGLGFLYISSSAARISTCIPVLLGDVFLALLPLLLCVKHYILTHSFSSLAFWDTFLNRHKRDKKRPPDVMHQAQSKISSCLLFITLFIHDSLSWSAGKYRQIITAKADIRARQKGTNPCYYTMEGRAAMPLLLAEVEGTN